jgi:hypothetical protein
MALREVKRGKVYDKVKNKIYFITNAAATEPVGGGRECLSLTGRGRLTDS